MKLLITLFFICLMQSGFSQRGDNYIKLMKRLELVDSTSVNECFKNGKPKRCGLVYVYKHSDFFYEMSVGIHKQFYKDGSKTIRLFDSWGTEMISAHYDPEDNLTMEWVVTKIETNAPSLDVFLNSKKHITYNISFQDFRYDYQACKYYLRKEGQYSNGKKRGVWKFYLATGDLQKEKIYN